MSALLFGAGAIAFVAGAILVGFGIPVHEFSFGNTLILAGVVAMTGGLIVVALGMVVSHLQRLAEAMSRGVPGRAYVEGRVPAASARVPFPPRPKAELKSDIAARGPSAIEPIADQRVTNEAFDYVAPTLPNPDESPVTVEEEVALSPRHPFAPAPAADLDVSLPPAPFPPRAERAERDRAQDDLPAFEAAWRTTEKDSQKKSAVPPEVGAPKVEAPNAPASVPPLPVSAASKAASAPRPPTYFDSMWPAEPKEAKAEIPVEPKPDDKAEPLVVPKFQSAFAPQPPAEPKSEMRGPTGQDETPEPAFGWQNGELRQTVEPRTVAILKSGVVDGMGYTLYVDGSIEAELPQGTLHFASINELRSHLEKTS